MNTEATITRDSKGRASVALDTPQISGTLQLPHADPRDFPAGQPVLISIAALVRENTIAPVLVPEPATVAAPPTGAVPGPVQAAG